MISDRQTSLFYKLSLTPHSLLISRRLQLTEKCVLALKLITKKKNPDSSSRKALMQISYKGFSKMYQPKSIELLNQNQLNYS